MMMFAGCLTMTPISFLGARGRISLSVDERGLRYDITAPDTQTIRDLVLAPMVRGDINQSSFAFQVARDGETGTRMKGLLFVKSSKFSRLFDVSR
jgi:phage head maturation protease